MKKVGYFEEQQMKKGGESRGRLKDGKEGWRWVKGEGWQRGVEVGEGWQRGVEVGESGGQ